MKRTELLNTQEYRSAVFAFAPQVFNIAIRLPDEEEAVNAAPAFEWRPQSNVSGWSAFAQPQVALS